MVKLGFARDVHGPLQLARGPRRPHVHRAVIEGHGQRQGQSLAVQPVPETGLEQRRGLRPGACPDVVGVHIAVHVQIQAVPAALGRGAFCAAVATAEQAAAFLTGLPGQILHPAQGNAVLGEAAGIGRVVGKAALPPGGEGMGQLKGVGHDALLGGWGCCRENRRRG